MLLVSAPALGGLFSPFQVSICGLISSNYHASPIASASASSSVIAAPSDHNRFISSSGIRSSKAARRSAKMLVNQKFASSLLRSRSANPAMRAAARLPGSEGDAGKRQCIAEVDKSRARLLNAPRDATGFRNVVRIVREGAQPPKRDYCIAWEQ